MTPENPSTSSGVDLTVDPTATPQYSTAAGVERSGAEGAGAGSGASVADRVDPRSTDFESANHEDRMAKRYEIDLLRARLLRAETWRPSVANLQQRAHLNYVQAARLADDITASLRDAIYAGESDE